MSNMAKRDLRRVERAAQKIANARQELGTAILAAQDSGESLRDIAPFARLSYSRVYELAREARRRQTESL
jgi:hypothetical protein